VSFLRNWGGLPTGMMPFLWKLGRTTNGYDAISMELETIANYNPINFLAIFPP